MCGGSFAHESYKFFIKIRRDAADFMLMLFRLRKISASTDPLPWLERHAETPGSFSQSRSFQAADGLPLPERPSNLTARRGVPAGRDNRAWRLTSCRFRGFSG